ncbi:MAG: hypothetical protein ACLFUM_09395 [Spirochaetaceae bacterium]
MKSVLRFAAVALCVAVLIGACDMGLGTGGGDSARAPEDSSDVSLTGARVTVPRVSDRLLSALNATYEPAAGDTGSVGTQALIFATTVELEVYSDGDRVDTVTVSDEDGLNDPSQGEPMEVFVPIEEAGPDYTIEASVYNSRVGSEPVVSGESEPFTVNAGESTPVHIIATPVSPLIVDSDGGTHTDIGIAQTPYEFGPEGSEHDLVLTDIGGESWFEFIMTGAEDRYARVLVDPDGDADAVMLIYEDDGTVTEGMMDPPPWSWGMFPTAAGGNGGTRGAFMGELEDGTEMTAYLGVILLNRDGATTQEDFDIRLDYLVRPRPDPFYENVGPVSAEPDPAIFEPIQSGEEISQIIFRDDGTDEPNVHYFALDGIDWEAADLMDEIPVTVEVTLDVLESMHLFEGFLGGEGDESYPLIAVMAGNTESDESPRVYTALDDPDFEVTENADGSTTLSFVAQVETTEDGSGHSPNLGGIVVSSTWEGNQFTLEWTAPGEALVTVE